MRLWERLSRRWTAGLVLALVTVLGLAWFTASAPDRRLGDQSAPSRPASESKGKPAPPAAASKPKPAKRARAGVELKGTELRVMDPVAGRVAWELTLATAEFANSGEALLTGIDALYHNADGTTSALSAQRASLEAKQKALVFSGDVRLTAPNGGQLQAAELRWEAGQSGFVARGADGGQVTLTRGASVLKARELRGDLALGKVKATGGVRLSGQGS